MKGVAKVAPGEGNVQLIDVPEPQVKPGYVLIEVKAAGICGTDLHIYYDEFKTRPPVIMGHEVAGIVVLPHGKLPQGGLRILPALVQVRSVHPLHSPVSRNMVAKLHSNLRFQALAA